MARKKTADLQTGERALLDEQDLQMQKRRTLRGDGRYLIYYSFIHRQRERSTPAGAKESS